MGFLADGRWGDVVPADTTLRDDDAPVFARASAVPYSSSPAPAASASVPTNAPVQSI